MTQTSSVSVTALNYAALVSLTSLGLRVGQTLESGLACDPSAEGTNLRTAGFPHKSCPDYDVAQTNLHGSRTIRVRYRRRLAKVLPSRS